MDGKVINVNIAMSIKQEKDKLEAGLNDTLGSSTQALDNRLNIEPRANLLAGYMKLASESGAALAHVLPGNGNMFSMKVEKEAFVTQFEEPMEALDLSLPKKKEKSFKDRCVWITGDDTNFESSLLMEVDEIDDIRTEPEVEEDNEHSCELSDVHFENAHVTDHASLTSPLEVAVEEDLLLIDIEGVPYTLMPDGTKVPQPDSDDQSDHSDSASIEENHQPIVTEPVQAKRNLTHTPAHMEGSSPLKDPAVKSTGSLLSAALKSSPVLSNQCTLPVLPTMAGLPPQPIQVVANSTSNNAPFLILSPSQLQGATTAFPGKVGKGLMALSLPLALTQSAQSSPMFLVLSSVPVSPVQSSVTQVPILNTSSEQLSQIASQISSVSLPLSSGLPGGACPIITTNSPATKLMVPKSQCTTALAEELASSSSSPAGDYSVSSTVHARHANSAKTDDWTPQSFREALLMPNPFPDSETSRVELATTSCSSKENLAELPSPVTSSDFSDSKADFHPKQEQQSVPTTEAASHSVSSQDEQLVSSSSPTPPLSPSASLAFAADQPPGCSSPSSPTSGGPRRILYCRYCPRVFYYLSDLERHSITHSENKPHVCALCGKAFKRSSHLERHKHIHTGQRNFACAICGKRFREAGELMRHQRVHTGEKPFQCLLCHMRFAERNTLRRHTKRKHQGREREAMEADGSSSGAQRQQNSHGSTAQPLVLVAAAQEESAEWYSSTLPEMDSGSETDRDATEEGTL